MPEPQQVDATIQRIEYLIEKLGESDPGVRDMAEEVIRLLMRLYGAGLAQVVAVLGEEPDGRFAQRLTDDKLVASLLLLHGLHPVPAETRIQEALRRVERRLDGTRFGVTEISGQKVKVHVDAQMGSAPPATLAGLVERAVADAAPEISSVEFEGLPEPPIALVQIAPAIAK